MLLTFSAAFPIAGRKTGFVLRAGILHPSKVTYVGIKKVKMDGIYYFFTKYGERMKDVWWVGCTIETHRKMYCSDS